MALMSGPVSGKPSRSGPATAGLALGVFWVLLTVLVVLALK
jgi:hypothetical protein